jgi:peptidoglycan/xylan/chitin deacetylase (PgdA/CDA1 family)
MDLAASGYGGLSRLGMAARLDRLDYRHRNAVLLYLSVRPADECRPGTSDVSVAAFREHLEYLTDHFEVVDLPEARLNDGRGAGSKDVALTFDDGYRDFYTEVRPLLHEFDVPVTVFVCPELLDNAARREQVTNTGHLFDTLTSDQLLDLADDPLVTVGSHTRSHHDIGAHHDRDIIREEVVGAKRDLAQRFGVDCERFCYPNGGYNGTALDVVRDSHDIATVDGSGRPLLGSEDPMLVPRVDASLSFRRWRWNVSDANAELRWLARAVGVDLD